MCKIAAGCIPPWDALKNPYIRNRGQHLNILNDTEPGSLILYLPFMLCHRTRVQRSDLFVLLLFHAT